MSTQLRNGEVGYRRKTKSGRSSAIHKFKACAHGNGLQRAQTHKGALQQGSIVSGKAYKPRNKMRNSPEAAHKCAVCNRCHSYIRNYGVAGQSTRLRDCKEGY